MTLAINYSDQMVISFFFKYGLTTIKLVQLLKIIRKINFIMKRWSLAFEENFDFVWLLVNLVSGILVILDLKHEKLNNLISNLDKFQNFKYSHNSMIKTIIFAILWKYMSFWHTKSRRTKYSINKCNPLSKKNMGSKPNSWR